MTRVPFSHATDGNLKFAVEQLGSGGSVTRVPASSIRAISYNHSLSERKTRSVRTFISDQHLTSGAQFARANRAVAECARARGSTVSSPHPLAMQVSLESQYRARRRRKAPK
jgi:hypothetical protein